MTAACETVANDQGFYLLAFRSPGFYRIRVGHAKYQAQEMYGVELPVAGSIYLNVGLRRLTSLWDSDISEGRAPLSDDAAIVHYFTPDVEKLAAAAVQISKPLTGTLQSTLSYTIDPDQLLILPLSGRNVYQLLTFQPGVTSGLSVNGQRAASSSFLLDGVDSQIAIAPEFVQEYRVSTNNFSSEFGRATGFVANAITKEGSNSVHGYVYGRINNEILNANAFQSNKNDFPRQKHRELRWGGVASGPIVLNRTYFSAGYERYQSRTWEYPFTFRVPVLENFRRCPETARGQGLKLLERFPPPVTLPDAGPACDHLSGPYSFSIPNSDVNQGFGLARVDHLLKGGKHHLLARLIANREANPYDVFSLYPEFSSERTITTISGVAGAILSFSASTTTELRLGWQSNRYSRPRSHPEIPSLDTSMDGSETYLSGISLPGVSDAVSTRRETRNLWEFSDGTMLIRGPHILSLGGGFYRNRFSSYEGLLQSGVYQFASLQNFGRDAADSFSISTARTSPDQASAATPVNPPVYDGWHRRNEWYGFAQDSFRVSRRLVLNLGFRYDYFGVLQNTRHQDTYIQVGTPVASALPAARLVVGDACCRATVRPDRSDWSGRLGASYDLTGSGRHTVRTAYGLFYDRPPNTPEYVVRDPERPIWMAHGNLNNNLQVVTYYPPSGYLAAQYSGSPPGPVGKVVPTQGFPQLTLTDPGLRSPVMQSWFAGFHSSWSGSLSVEVNYAGSISRRLLTLDLINRTDASNLNTSRLNVALPDILYASNSGRSKYNALTSLLRYRSRRLILQAAYTLGHSIDNQSDTENVFTRQFDDRLDWASSDFDQRQNLVAYGMLQIPTFGRKRWQQPWMANWQVGALMGFRTGFPYTVLADTIPGVLPCGGTSGGHGALLIQNRPNLLPGVQPLLDSPVPAPGGVLLLNASAFCQPPPDVPGNLGRNSLVGPGFWNVDLSVGKYFPIPWLGEGGRMQMRADFFNAANHANLGNPILSNTGLGVFGEAFYGKHALPPGGVSFVPLDETPRRIELELRFVF